MILISPSEALYWAASGLVIIFMLLKVIGKILSDHNTCIVSLFYRLRGNIVILLLLHHWYCYWHRIVPVIEITWLLIDLHNKVIEQLTPELGKLMEERSSVFWVDLGYRLRSRDAVLLQGFGGWLASHIVHMLLLMLLTTIAVGPGSASGDWAVISGMYETHLKYGQCLFY